jgi:hypothetical protein
MSSPLSTEVPDPSSDDAGSCFGISLASQNYNDKKNICLERWQLSYVYFLYKYCNSLVRYQALANV